MKRIEPRNRVALITGASSGIGRALSREFAARGTHLVLVARRGELLEELSSALTAEFGVRVRTIVMDLARPESPAELYELTEGSGQQIDFLINNAGIGRVKMLAEDQPEPLRAMMNLNMQSLTELTLRFAGAMRVRKWGGILQVSSMLALIPLPGMSVYAASKSYVYSFSRALQVELDDSGVWVSVLCPGTVPSGFQEVAGFGAAPLSVPGQMLPEEVAKVALDAFLKRQQVIFPGLTNRLTAWILPLIPRGLLARIAFQSLQRIGRFG